jgi:dihydrofolate reductase
MTPTRRLVMFNHLSADGYFSAANGSLGWVTQDEEFDRETTGGPQRFDTILFGRRTYDMFASFWPHVVSDDPNAPAPHHSGRQSEATRAMGRFLNDADKLVFSHAPQALTWKNTRAAGVFDPAAVQALKAQPGKDLIIFGSGTIVSLLTAHDLIDEYELVLSPILLGGGRPLIAGLPEPRALVLLEAKSYASGNVKLRFGKKQPGNTRQ